LIIEVLRVVLLEARVMQMGWASSSQELKSSYCLQLQGKAVQLDTADPGTTNLRNIVNHSPSDIAITPQKTGILSSTTVRAPNLAPVKLLDILAIQRKLTLQRLTFYSTILCPL
jgi:hypothetical protein